MSTIYPRTIDIHRSQNVSAQSPRTGLLGYSGREASPAPADPEGEIVMFEGLPASIQPKTAWKSHDALPSGATDLYQWIICIPRSALPQYSIRDLDIIIDDEGYRYQVQANSFLSGYQLTCIRLQA